MDWSKRCESLAPTGLRSSSFRRNAVPDMRPDSYQILLVEDDEDDYLLTKDLVAEIDGSRPALCWVRDFRTALEEAKMGSFDVCLVDYRLGGTQDGIDLIRALIDD